MKIVILAGGMGARAYPFTAFLPKPMMPVYGKPMLMRIMGFFADQGYTDFVLSVGHRKEVIIDYFHSKRSEWNIDIIDTGLDADTGDRIYRCKKLLTEPFFATYGDGLSDVDLGQLLDFHQSHGHLATVTSVPLVSQYGTLETDERGRVVNFKEKPKLHGHWINAGFFVMQPEVFSEWSGNNLEKDILPALSKKNELYTYRHDGFFKSMDTQKDQQELDEIFSAGEDHLLPASFKASQGETP